MRNQIEILLKACLGPSHRYGGAVDVTRVADLYAQGWTLRQTAVTIPAMTTPRRYHLYDHSSGWAG